MSLRYENRCMSVNGKKYYKDLKVIENEVYGNWWRKEGHLVDLDDLIDILSEKPDIIVIGTGYAGFMELSVSLRSALKKRNIELIAAITSDAVKAFNSFQSKGRKVAGAFHLTC